MDRIPTLDDLKRIKKKTLEHLDAYGLTTPAAQGVLFAVVGSAGTLAFLTIRRRYVKRIVNSDAVPPSALDGRRWIKGVVTSVGDGDNFRLFHTPGLFWRFPIKLRSVPKTSKELKDQTIHIRMAGVDAPEAAHFGKPGQPYAEEARQWLENTVIGKRVWCQLVFRDQYKRIVAIPRLPNPIIPSFLYKGRNVSLMMIKAGWGVTYTQTNADYGKDGLDKYVRTEEQARKARRGMWASKKALESPSAFKKRTNSGASPPTPPLTSSPQATGWLRSIFRR